MLEYNRGQGMDMYWKDNFICPTEKDYKIMAIRSKLHLQASATCKKCQRLSYVCIKFKH